MSIVEQHAAAILLSIADTPPDERMDALAIALRVFLDGHMPLVVRTPCYFDSADYDEAVCAVHDGDNAPQGRCRYRPTGPARP